MYLDDALPTLQLDQDISRLQVPVPHMVSMQVLEDMQHLPQQQLYFIRSKLTSAISKIVHQPIIYLG